MTSRYTCNTHSCGAVLSEIILAVLQVPSVFARNQPMQSKSRNRWLPLDRTNGNTVGEIEPAAGPLDPELSAMASLPTFQASYSLLDVLEQIYQDYAAGYPNAPYRVNSASLCQEEWERVEKILHRYGVPFARLLDVPTGAPRQRICDAGMAGITRIRKDCYRLGADIDVNALVLRDIALAAEMTELKAWCQRLEYLCRTGRACSGNRARIEKVLAQILNSRALRDIELLRGRKDFTELYFKFCELTLMGEDTAVTIRDLRKLVKNEHDLASLRVKEFSALREQYEGGGRRDLIAVMQANAKAARKEGFQECDGSAAETQQIYDELEQIDRNFSKIGDTLKESKEFWEGVGRKLGSLSSSSCTGHYRAKDPPHGITTGPERLRIDRQAAKIHAGLQTVHRVIKRRSCSKRVLKACDKIVKAAENLTNKCTGVVRTHTSVELHLRTPTCDFKSGRKAISPLTKGLGYILSGYEKLSLRFTKWAETIYLLFWFAGNTAIDKLPADRLGHVQVAQAELLSKGLFTSSYSSYALPFEAAFTRLETRLLEMQRLWTKVVLRVDGISGSSILKADL
ncbi:hypothetical protein MVEN_00971300 [Mycena venus]|uniref:Uncharacterized protein n=1 Tax=Mycena venus TaxID=2733690 RepID=A0A8H6YC36_9AGAR|nr:hypothetical protein MVEN_00971300 [Mycena venus]